MSVTFGRTIVTAADGRRPPFQANEARPTRLEEMSFLFGIGEFAKQIASGAEVSKKTSLGPK